MHTEKQTFNINYLHWLHLHSEKIKFFFNHGTCTCFIRNDVSYKRGHQLSDLNKSCLGQIFVEI